MQPSLHLHAISVIFEFPFKASVSERSRMILTRGDRQALRRHHKAGAMSDPRLLIVPLDPPHPPPPCSRDRFCQTPALHLNPMDRTDGKDEA